LVWLDSSLQTLSIGTSYLVLECIYVTHIKRDSRTPYVVSLLILFLINNIILLYFYNVLEFFTVYIENKRGSVYILLIFPSTGGLLFFKLTYHALDLSYLFSSIHVYSNYMDFSYCFF